MARSPIIDPADLLDQVSENMVIIDARGGVDARLNYEAKHLQGAIFVDLETQLADIKDDFADGGRHPLPDIEKFASVVSDLGISMEDHVVVYDDKNGANAAARFWWMLRSTGHPWVQVLSGGIQQAEKVGFPMSTEIPEPTKKARYSVHDWLFPVADIEEVERVALLDDHLVIDVREPRRFDGESEPIDLVAGHIPGAVNIPLLENLDENGLFLAPGLLREKYGQVVANQKSVIIHCGSGVTACHSILAMSAAGLAVPKLYVGSWSEWSRANKKMITK